MNGTRFRLMKPTSYFINIGRGRTTRLDDLVAALETGEIKPATVRVSTSAVWISYAITSVLC